MICARADIVEYLWDDCLKVHMEKDYVVQEVRLFDVVHHAIAEDKYLLWQNGVRIALRETDDLARGFMCGRANLHLRI